MRASAPSSRDCARPAVEGERVPEPCSASRPSRRWRSLQEVASLDPSARLRLLLAMDFGEQARPDQAGLFTKTHGSILAASERRSHGEATET